MRARLRAVLEASRRAATRDRAGRGPVIRHLRQSEGPPTPPPPEVEGVSFRPDTLAGLTVDVAEPPVATADVLFLHAGGFIAGTASTPRRLTGAIARESGMRLWSLGYRLAPEHPYPAASDDVIAAYRAISQRVDPGRIAIAGESCGGGLAAALLVRARDAGLPLPAAAVLLCPFTDLTLSGSSFSENAGKDLLPPHVVEVCRDLYVGRNDPADPRISPLFADLSHLPPTLIQVGEYDVLRDDSVRYAASAARAGSPVEIRKWAGLGHGFCGPGDETASARAGIAEIATWLRATLGAT